MIIAINQILDLKNENKPNAQQFHQPNIGNPLLIGDLSAPSLY